MVRSDESYAVTRHGAQASAVEAVSGKGAMKDASAEAVEAEDDEPEWHKGRLETPQPLEELFSEGSGTFEAIPVHREVGRCASPAAASSNEGLRTSWISHVRTAHYRTSGTYLHIGVSLNVTCNASLNTFASTAICVASGLNRIAHGLRNPVIGDCVRKPGAAEYC